MEEGCSGETEEENVEEEDENVRLVSCDIYLVDEFELWA